MVIDEVCAVAHNTTSQRESLETMVQCARLSDPAQGLLRPGVSPGLYLGQLIDAELYKDALRLAAFTIPTREGVWWGCVCVGEVFGPFAPAPTQRGVTAAMEWVMRPSEQTRRQAEKIARDVGMSDAGGCMAMAAFWSGGNVSQPDLPHVDPKPHQAQQAITAGITIAANVGDPDTIEERRRVFLNYAIEVASGKRRWPA